MSDRATRNAVLQLLSATPDPTGKAAILSALTPDPLAREDLAPLMAELRAVHDADDPALRAVSLLQMAQWDRSEVIMPLLRQGLYDADTQVVRAAITAVTLSNVRTQDIKEALLVLANDTAPDSEARVAAIEALRDFSLTRGEYAIYRSAVDSTPDQLAH